MIESEPFQNMISFTFFPAEEENPFEIVNAISKTYLVYLALEMTPDWELYGLLSQMDCLKSIEWCLPVGSEMKLMTMFDSVRGRPPVFVRRCRTRWT